MLTLEPKSALATMLVILKSLSLTCLLVKFFIYFAIFIAPTSASSSVYDPIKIIHPDLKIKAVALGLVFLMMTAGNLFLLYLDPDTFWAIKLRSRLA